MRPILTLLFTFCVTTAFTQTVTWTAPVPVASSSHGNLFPRISLDRSGDPMVVFGSASGQVQFAKWNGTGFSMPVAVNMASMPAFTANWAGPELGNHGDTVYVVFKRTPETDSTNHIYLLTSFNGGQSFGAPARVDFIGDSLSRFGAVTTDPNGQPIVSFMKFNSSFGDARYVVTRSSDYGNTFSPDVKASGYTGGEVCDCCPSTIINSGSKTVLLYRNNLSNIRTIWAGVSNNNGATFTTGMEVDNTNWMVMACPSSGPDGVVVGDTLYSVFRSSASGQRVYLSKSTLSSQQLISSNKIIADFTGLTSQDYPRIAHSGNAAAIAWKQVSGGVAARAVVSFTSNIHTGFSTYDTIAASGVTNVDIAMKDGEIHVVWENDATGTVMYSKGTYSTTAVASISTPVRIQVYPNPASKFLTVPVADVKSCTLTDVAGKQLTPMITPGTGTTHIRVDALPKGVYTLTAIDSNGSQFYAKFSVE